MAAWQKDLCEPCLLRQMRQQLFQIPWLKQIYPIVPVKCLVILMALVVLRLPPNIKALMGTPSGFSQLASILGHWDAGAVNRAFGCATGFPLDGSCRCPCQLVRFAGGFFTHSFPPYIAVIRNTHVCENGIF